MNLDGPRASLVFGGPLPVSRPAKIERVTPPAITKLVDARSAANLVRRNTCRRARPAVPRRRRGGSPPRAPPGWRRRCPVRPEPTRVPWQDRWRRGRQERRGEARQTERGGG